MDKEAFKRVNKIGINIVKGIPKDGWKLRYDYEINSFRGKGHETIKYGNQEVKVFYHYIHDYYPKNRYDEEDIDENIKKVRRIIYDFKDGRNSIKIAEVFANAINNSGIELSNICLIPIPASTPEKTNKRYKEFCGELSNLLKINNALHGISTKSHIPTKGISTGNKIKYFSLVNNTYQDKVVLLVDDIITSGTTFRQLAQELMNTGAEKVIGIFLAKTY